MAFPITGLLALLWFLIRVLPKPSRATYPCQRASLPIASGFVIWLIGSVSALWGARWLHVRLRQHRSALALVSLATALGIGTWMLMGMPSSSAVAYTPTDAPNSPMGVAKGINPGRVVWYHDAQAATWNGTSGNWWSDTSTNQTIVDTMLSSSLQTLTSTTSDTAAWTALFHYFNQSHGKGDVGYATGEQIAIKLNLNNNGSQTDADNGIDASPHLVLSLLRELVNGAGVPQAMITVYDGIRAMPNRIYNKGHTEFPNVVWADSVGGNGRVKVQWKTSITYSKTNGCGTTIPSFLVDSTNYIINMPIMKGHEYAGVTLTAKNHYGSLQTREHDLIYAHNYPMGNYSHLVDLMGHKNLDGKAFLFILDGLYATCINTDTVSTATAGWKKLFGGAWASSLFVSQDPVALDSVGFDFLNAEWSGGSDARFNTAISHADNYMHEAAQANNPPSGTVYAPNGDGVRLSSLGTHEHWNNATDKQYSRNLGTGNGIELVKLPVTISTGGTPGTGGAAPTGGLTNASGTAATGGKSAYTSTIAATGGIANTGGTSASTGTLALTGGSATTGGANSVVTGGTNGVAGSVSSSTGTAAPADSGSCSCRVAKRSSPIGMLAALSLLGLGLARAARRET